MVGRKSSAPFGLQAVIEPFRGQVAAVDGPLLAQDSLADHQAVARIVGVGADLAAPAPQRVEALLILHLHAKRVPLLAGGWCDGLRGGRGSK